MSKKKKARVLFCNEYSGLKTGYSNYGREVISRLHNHPDIEIAEFATCLCDGQKTEFPWKIYPVAPHPSNKEEVAKFNSNPLYQYGELRFEETCLDFRPTHVCSPPGELVLTESGYKKIEDVCIGEMVMTHKGRFRAVKQVIRRQYDGDLLSVYFCGCSEPLKLTPRHPVLIYKKIKQTNRKKSIKKIYDGISPIFHPIEEIKIGDLMMLPDFNFSKEMVSLNISDYSSQFYIDGDMIYIPGFDNHIKNMICLDNDFGRLLGYIWSDGHVSASGVTITFNGKEQRFIDDAAKIWLDKFGIKSKVTPVKGKFAIDIKINSVLIANFFKKCNFVKYIWNNEDFMKGVVAGLVRGDGCYKRDNTVSFCSIKKDMAHLYRIMCSVLDIPTNICKSKKAYEVDGYCESSLLLHNIVNKHDNLGYEKKEKSCRRTDIVNGHIVSSVRRINKSHYKGQVYNLEVEEDNSYIIQQSCVHNCDIRDPWMYDYQERSPFRSLYNWILMPTVDAEPQSEEWLSPYINADKVFTYNDWSLDVLNRESGGRVKTVCSAPPSADSCFAPMNKDVIKKSMGIGQNTYIVGTVMRNQRRKLFPDLFQSFRKLIDNSDKNIFLYCHTSYPDSWDIPALIKEFGLNSRVLFTYVCRNCKHFFPMYFNGVTINCMKCGQNSCGLSSINSGISNENLALIYNTFDLYVQYSVCEGFGIPPVEAAACGVPVMEVDYSAMADVVRKLNGTPIRVLSYTREPETGRKFAVPDNDHLSEQMIKFFNMPKSMMAKKGFDARQGFEKHYNNWDETANKWADAIFSLPNKDLWSSPPNIKNPPPFNLLGHTSNSDYARYLISYVLQEPRFLNTYLELRLSRDLNSGVRKDRFGAGLYYNELSATFSKDRFQKFVREDAYNEMAQMRMHINYWERQRVL